MPPSEGRCHLRTVPPLLRGPFAGRGDPSRLLGARSPSKRHFRIRHERRKVEKPPRSTASRSAGTASPRPRAAPGAGALSRGARRLRSPNSRKRLHFFCPLPSLLPPSLPAARWPRRRCAGSGGAVGAGRALQAFLPGRAATPPRLLKSLPLNVGGCFNSKSAQIFFLFKKS